MTPSDQPRWLELARGYKAFYKTPVTDAEYQRAWKRLLANDRAWGLGARHDGQLVGITHYLFHSSTWNEEVCYLQDLFVDPAFRGRGIARALIEAVAKAALARGAE
ncbi:MAG TPA: GNAT family N-acetyltransferase, partial [Burkholderiales bacterium]|nr:GNAT family N-acetyltransferase [Burkholderiales bacterium]